MELTLSIVLSLGYWLLLGRGSPAQQLRAFYRILACHTTVMHKPLVSLSYHSLKHNALWGAIDLPKTGPNAYKTRFV